MQILLLNKYFNNAFVEIVWLRIFKLFKNKVEDSFEWVGGAQEDIFVISFYSWLKGKMNNTDLYQTTLTLIKQAQ